MKRLDTLDAGFEAAFTALLDDARETTQKVDGVVAGIIADIRARGDAALVDYTSRFDRWQPGSAAASTQQTANRARRCMGVGACDKSK